MTAPFDFEEHRRRVLDGHAEHLRLLAEPAPSPPAADASKEECDQYAVDIAKREIAQDEVDAHEATMAAIDAAEAEAAQAEQ